LKKYGTTLNKRSLAEETALLGAMLNEWKERAELDNALDLLHLKPWAAHLEGLNNSFDNLYLLRSTEMGQKKKGAMQARKKEMEAAYKSLCDMLVSQYIIHKKTEPYASLLRTLNAAIQQLKTSMKQSGKRTPRAKKTTTDTTNTHQEQP
jgi:outer membrane murein-binding lipoprotein Lpp